MAENTERFVERVVRVDYGVKIFAELHPDGRRDGELILAGNMVRVNRFGVEELQIFRRYFINKPNAVV